MIRKKASYNEDDELALYLSHFIRVYQILSIHTHAHNIKNRNCLSFVAFFLNKLLQAKKVIINKIESKR